MYGLGGQPAVARISWVEYEHSSPSQMKYGDDSSGRTRSWAASRPSGRPERRGARAKVPVTGKVASEVRESSVRAGFDDGTRRAPTVAVRRRCGAGVADSVTHPTSQMPWRDGTAAKRWMRPLVANGTSSTV